MEKEHPFELLAELAPLKDKATVGLALAKLSALREIHPDDPVVTICTAAGWIALLADAVPKGLADEREALLAGFDARAVALTNCVTAALEEAQRISTEGRDTLARQETTWRQVQETAHALKQSADRLGRLKRGWMASVVITAFVIGCVVGHCT